MKRTTFFAQEIAAREVLVDLETKGIAKEYKSLWTEMETLFHVAEAEGRQSIARDCDQVVLDSHQVWKAERTELQKETRLARNVRRNKAYAARNTEEGVVDPKPAAKPVVPRPGPKPGSTTIQKLNLELLKQAQDISDLREQNQDLKRRIEDLEAFVSEEKRRRC